MWFGCVDPAQRKERVAGIVLAPPAGRQVRLRRVEADRLVGISESLAPVAQLRVGLAQAVVRTRDLSQVANIVRRLCGGLIEPHGFTPRVPRNMHRRDVREDAKASHFHYRLQGSATPESLRQQRQAVWIVLKY